MTHLIRNTALLAAAIVCTGLRAAEFSVAVDPGLSKELMESIRAAGQEGEMSKALRDLRRLLELYPNEPVVRAPIYMAMSGLAEKNGDAELSRQYRATALALNPDLPEQMKGLQATAPTRGDKADAFLAAFGVAAQTLAQVQQARTQYAQQHPKGVSAQPALPVQFPAQPIGVAAQMSAPAGGFPPVGGFDPNAPQPLPSPVPAPGAFDPQGQPAFIPPPPMVQQPMVQQAYPQQQMPQQAYPQQQMPQQAYPQQQMPQQQMPPAYPQQQPYLQQMPQQQMQQPMPQQPYPPQQQMNQSTYAPGGYPQARYPPRMPYQAPPQYAPQYARGRTRGDTTSKPVRVVYDRSRLGDSAYFATACGAILDVEGGSLTFTSGCGEAPLVIPAAEISEIGMNLAVGREIGAFHIATAKGLYLALAAEGRSGEQSREIVNTLKQELGLNQ